MKSHPNEMWLFLDTTSSSHKKTRALAYTITPNINEFSFRHSKISRLQWIEILDLLQMRPKDLFNKANKKYQSDIAGHEFDHNSWLEILRNNPLMIKGPIAIMNGHAKLCIKPKDILLLDQQHSNLH